MNHKLLVALAGATMMAGCASPKAEWHKSGVSSDDTYTQLSECRFQVGINKVSKSDQEELIGHCMRGKGFRLHAKPD